MRPDDLTAKFGNLGVVSVEFPCQLPQLQVGVICSLLYLVEKSSDRQQPSTVPRLGRIRPASVTHRRGDIRDISPGYITLRYIRKLFIVA